ncbi:hypothetical protein BQ8794_240301 [Mesorhizobium prunaredense]|uniref:Uncharacterized protein n=1 Tax=Mesorhizobium prunaredense TaxID=1631249 RepID=A0A1R3V8A4_9HYPH|nr:hypothetical protein BQ8794_240301 [Mesorhizobium prunaredense]
MLNGGAIFPQRSRPEQQAGYSQVTDIAVKNDVAAKLGDSIQCRLQAARLASCVERTRIQSALGYRRSDKITRYSIQCRNPGK